MRHAKAGNRLSRNQSLRKATLRDMAKAVFLQERICTTRAKAKEAKKLIEKLITLGKKDTLAARRRAFAILCDHNIVSQLFSRTAPRFKARNGGYTRIISYTQRGGDNAALAFLELTEKSRTIITGQKRIKAVKEAAKPSAVSEAEVKPVVAPTAGGVATPTHSQADVKSTPKATAKFAGIRKLFQRKTGGE
jgi:large subunit ribosomal protein L17